MNNIITYKGYKNLQDIEVGDFLYDGMGSYKRVDNISSMLGETTYEIKLNGIQDKILVGDNKVLGYRGYKSDRCSDKLTWFNVSDLKAGDTVCYKISSLRDGYTSNDKDLATFLGYFVLYGFINIDKGKVVIHLDSSKDIMRSSILESINRLFPNAFVDEYLYQGEDFISIVDSMAIMLCSRFGERFENRVLIEEIINSEVGFLEYFVRPLYEYNLGRDGNFFMPSSSYELLLGYQRILYRLNKFSNVYTCKSKDNKFKYYALNMNRAEFKRTINDSSWFMSDGYIFIKIDSIMSYSSVIKTYDFGDTSYCDGLLVIK